jgi:hypothetical protein
MPSQTGAMSFYREQILPRLTDLALRGKNTAQLRARAAAGLSGEVLEVGFGSALTMPYYPPAVTRVRGRSVCGGAQARGGQSGGERGAGRLRRRRHGEGDGNDG